MSLTKSGIKVNVRKRQYLEEELIALIRANLPTIACALCREKFPNSRPSVKEYDPYTTHVVIEVDIPNENEEMDHYALNIGMYDNYYLEMNGEPLPDIMKDHEVNAFYYRVKGLCK